MISITTNAQALKELAKTLANDSKLLKRDINVALNATAKHLKGQWAKEVGKEVALPQKVIKTTISQILARADGEPTASVKQSQTKRLPLKEFKPRQTRAGVAYTAYKGAKRKTLGSAFIVKKIGGHVFSRQGAKIVASKGSHKGKMRQPIVKRFGPSPYETTKKHDIADKLVALGDARLLVELNKRIRFRKLKASGAI